MNFRNFRNRPYIGRMPIKMADRTSDPQMNYELPRKDNSVEHLTNPLNSLNWDNEVYPRRVSIRSIQRRHAIPSPIANNERTITRPMGTRATSHMPIRYSQGIQFPSRNFKPQINRANCNVTRRGINVVNRFHRHPSRNFAFSKHPSVGQNTVLRSNQQSIIPRMQYNVITARRQNPIDETVQKADNSLSKIPHIAEKGLKEKIIEGANSLNLKLQNKVVLDSLAFVVEDRMSEIIKKISGYSKKRLDTLKDYKNAIKVTNDSMLNFEKMIDEEVKEFNLREEIQRKANISNLLRLSSANDDQKNKITDSLVEIKKKRTKKRSLVPPSSAPKNPPQKAEVKAGKNAEMVKEELETKSEVAANKNFVGKKVFKKGLEHRQLNPRRHAQRKLTVADCISFLEEFDCDEFSEVLFKAYNKLY